MSRPLARLLVSTGVSPNHITILGTIVGLASAYCYLQDERIWASIGGALFFAYYLMDHIDGDLARLLRRSTRIGALLDDFSDWLVHGFFFLALGFQVSRSSGDSLWMWMGVAAAVGGTLNTLLALINGPIQSDDKISLLSEMPTGKTWLDSAGFILRGLIKADFWLIVLILSLAGYLWVLLPAAAIGAQIFWMLFLRKSMQKIHT